MQTQHRPFLVSGKEGDEISLPLAASWTRNYRQMQPNETISHLFGQEILKQILAQDGCMGIRIYYSNSLRLNLWQRFILSISNFLRKVIANAEGEKHLILVGVENTGIDQIPRGAGATDANLMAASDAAAPKYTLAQQAIPCPGSAGCPQNELT